MKYIRTKDGRIIDLSDKDYIVNGNDLILHEEYESVGGFPTDKKSMTQISVAVITKHNEYNFVGTIEKQADTIEELCDEFVKKTKETWNNYFAIGEDALRIFDRKYHREDLEHYDYYGAIWTDKGLIYVAKMNDKGELKLL